MWKSYKQAIQGIVTLSQVDKPSLLGIKIELAIWVNCPAKDHRVSRGDRF